jgi:hypothetical protein
VLDPAEPQIVVNCRTLYFSWLPADPDAVASMVPAGLRPRADRQVFMNQYVVDDAAQTSGLGAYSVTYLGISLTGADAPDSTTSGGWWTHYLTSSPLVRAYAAARGLPAALGHTRMDIRGEYLTAETETDGSPLIRARVRVGETGHAIRSGHLRYVTARDGELMSNVYPYVAEPVTPFEIESVEFLEPSHPAYALRPANPLTIAWGLYSPRFSFACPGGQSRWPAAQSGAAERPQPSPQSPAERPQPAHQVPARRARSGLPSGS